MSIDDRQKENRQLDCFYTKQHVVRMCLDRLMQKADVSGHDIWLEPSAGSGAFLKHLPQPRIGLDIAPSYPSIMQSDFLQWQPNFFYKSMIVVGNPPFGKNSSLAVKFFNHATKFSSRIAMIFPRTFRKDSIVNRLNNNFHLQDELILESDSFELSGVSHAVPTVFQIWSYQAAKRAMRCAPKTHADFMFVNKDLADFAIQRVGANAGRVKQNINAVSPNSHYFLKTKNALAREAFHQLDWATVKYDTAGNPSISKPDIVNLYTKWISNHAR